MQVRGPDRSGFQGGPDNGGYGRRDDIGLVPELPPGTVIRPNRDTAPRRTIGLDLGQAADYAALSIAERFQVATGRYRILPGETEIVATGRGRYPEYRPAAIAETYTELQIRHLQQWDIGTSYVHVVNECMEIIGALLTLQAAEDAQAKQADTSGQPWYDTAPPVIAIDHTGVGIAVVDLFRSKPCPIPLVAVTITHGTAANARPQTDDAYRSWTVPKSELIGPMLVAVQNGRLKVAPELPLAKALNDQMAAFRMKLRGTAGVSYEAMRERDHDDLVVAVSLAAWAAHRIDMQRNGQVYL